MYNNYLSLSHNIFHLTLHKPEQLYKYRKVPTVPQKFPRCQKIPMVLEKFPWLQKSKIKKKPDGQTNIDKYRVAQYCRI